MKKISIILFTILICTCVSFATLISSTKKTVNTINEATITCVSHIQKDSDDISNIIIENTSDEGCYIRFKIITCHKENKQIHYDTKEPTVNILDSCKYIDGYYYYSKMLPAHHSTTNLIDSNIEASNDLYVDVISEAIQANNPNALKEMWHVLPKDFIS